MEMGEEAKVAGLSQHIKDSATLKTSRKHCRLSDFESTQNAVRGPKRQSRQAVRPAQIAFVHQVACSGMRDADADHSGHPELMNYFDRPRLLKGQTKASTLQGEQAIHDLEDLREDADVVTYLTYQCVSYFKVIKDYFVNFAPPQLDRRVFRANRPHFFCLGADGPFARAQSVRIEIRSSQLANGLSNMEALLPDISSSWKSERNMASPFPWLFHHRQKLKELSAFDHYPGLDSVSVSLIQSLIQCIENISLEDYREAEQLFSNGVVTRKHFNKLFCGGDVVIARQDGVVRGYVVEAINDHWTHQRTDLHCWSWFFDGTFKKSPSVLEVPWPQSDEQARITEMIAYPLRFDDSEARDMLLNRGTKFWSCRRRKYVQYTAPKLPFEPRLVSTITLSNMTLPTIQRADWNLIQTALYDRL